MKTAIAGFVLLILLYCHVSCKSQTKVWVVDNTHLLTSHEVNILDSIVQNHELKTTNEIGILVDNCQLDSSVLKHATALGNQYGVGKKEKNNGLFVLICLNEQKMAIATGKGIEHILTDSIAQLFINEYFIPDFKKAAYFDGIRKGILAITQFLEKPENNLLH